MFPKKKPSTFVEEIADSLGLDPNPQEVGLKSRLEIGDVLSVRIISDRLYPNLPEDFQTRKKMIEDFFSQRKELNDWIRLQLKTCAGKQALEEMFARKIQGR